MSAIVRGDARLELAGEITPGELERALASLEPEVVLAEGGGSLAGGDGDALDEIPTVALVRDLGRAWDLRAPHAGHLRSTDTGGTGAHAFALLAEDASAEEIVAALVAVAAGLVVTQPRALADDGAREGIERLTPREIEVLAALADGTPNKTIAGRLGISEHTVKYHVGAIFAKLGVASRTEAVTRGIRLGLIML
ncbi:MAG: helix-turn-helix domain-containing protein [Vulcanimicrobiaceae bacterium]